MLKEVNQFMERKIFLRNQFKEKLKFSYEKSQKSLKDKKEKKMQTTFFNLDQVLEKKRVF